MKKLNVFIFLLIILIFQFSGCKSNDISQEDINPLELLEDTSSFYISLPSSVDTILTQKLLLKNIQGLNTSQAKELAERIEVIHLGLTRKKTSVDFQLASKISLPGFIINDAFTKNKGWKKVIYPFENNVGKIVNYTGFSNNSINVSFPDNSICVASYSIFPLLDNYNKIKNKDNSSFLSVTSPELFDWLNESLNEDEIRFFATRPQSFLTMLTGANLSFKLKYVCGLFENDENNPKQYKMNLEFEFRDYRMIPAAKGALSVAFGLTDSEVILETPTHLKIRNIKINKDQLYKILVL